MDKNYGIFKRNIPVEYAQIKREYLYDLKKHHGEVEDCIIFGLSAITGKSILFHAIMETVLSSIVFRLQRLYNAASNRKMFLGVDLMSYSFGIVSVIILLFILGIS